MSHPLYFINHKSAMFATFADKPLVVGSPDEYKIFELKKIVDRQKRVNNKWLNKCLRYYQHNKMDHLKISSYPENKEAEAGVLPTYISKIDLDEPEGIEFINELYQLCEVELFMMYDFEHVTDGDEYLLTLTGVHIAQEDVVENDDKDIPSYLESMFQLCT